MKVMVEVTLFSLLQVTTAFYHDFLMSCVFILFSHHDPKVFISNKPLCRYFFKLINLFIFGCVGSSLPCIGFLQLQRAGATLRCGAWASHCSGFSFCRAQALSTRASVVVAHGLISCGFQALEHRLSSCGARAQLLCGMWDLPGPGIEPVSPALAGGFLSTAPPRKSLQIFLKSSLP